MTDDVKNPLEMSDEDFLNQTPPEVKDKDEDQIEDTPEPTDDVDDSDIQDEGNEPTDEDKKKEEEPKDLEDDSQQESNQEGEVNKEPSDLDQEGNKNDLSKLDKVSESTSKVDESSEKIDYEGFYKKVMAPFKANGKMISLRNPEEAIKLMQQGANFTKKMQTIAPYRKLLIMLENNDLLDESKLNYLIDLDKKNPEAIKKLVKDAGIDPVDIDTDEESKYQPSNHQVSDKEANFVSVLDELKQDAQGVQTLQEINQKWDEQSKNALWEDPSIMQTIHAQRETGVYQKICEEMERQKMLGNIPNNTPFLVAYKQVGDWLVQQNVKRQPVATKKVMPKSQVTNSARAKAAAPTRSNKNKVEKFINPLSMSDDDFLKQFENRL